jgi:hypothetical protein
MSAVACRPFAYTKKASSQSYITFLNKYADKSSEKKGMRMIKKAGFSITLIAGIATIMYLSGGLVIGSGNFSEEFRQVNGFDKVVFSGSDMLVVKQGESFSLKIIAEDNILDRIRADVRSGTLQIELANTIFWPLFIFRDIIRYELTMPYVAGLESNGSGVLEANLTDGEQLQISLGGSGVINIEGINHQVLSASLNGSGVIKLDGRVEQHQVSLNGSGNYSAKDLMARQAEIRLNGSGNVSVWAISSLDIELNGSGNLSYYGAPQVSQRVSGSGNIKEMGAKE